MTDDYEEHRYRSGDGRLDLFARDYPADEVDAPALLLMHGLTRNSADFEPLIPHLSGRYRLIVPDQRGRGLSQYDDEPENYRPDVYAADMIALLDGLGIARAGLIGTSMGGLMAMVMGAMQRERFAAMVFNDIGPVIEDAGLDRIAGYVGLGPAKPASDWQEAASRAGAINRDAFPEFGDADWLAFARRTYRETGPGAISVAYDPAIANAFEGDGGQVAPEQMWALWDMLAGIPALVVRGALSDLLSAATVAEMERRHEAHFAAVEVPGRGHAPLLDEPAALSAILDFLDAVYPA